MDQLNIQLAQEYLTITEDDRKIKIIDVEELVQKIPSASVVEFLEELLKDKMRIIKDLAVQDRTNQKLDKTVASCFRIKMALNNLKEVRTL